MKFDGEIGILQQIPRQHQHHGLIRLHETLLDQLLQSRQSYGRRRFASDPFRADLRFRLRDLKLTDLFTGAAGRLQDMRRLLPRSRITNPNRRRARLRRNC